MVHATESCCNIFGFVLLGPVGRMIGPDAREQYNPVLSRWDSGSERDAGVTECADGHQQCSCKIARSCNWQQLNKRLECIRERRRARWRGLRVMKPANDSCNFELMCVVGRAAGCIVSDVTAECHLM